MEYLGGKPLCMNQYYQILSSCRVPGPKQDSVINFSKTKKPPMHITVVHNYQVGGPPEASPPRRYQGGGGQAKSQLPQFACPWTPQDRHALGISTGARRGPGLTEGRRGCGPTPQPGESNAGTSSPSHLWPDPIPSSGPGTVLAVTSGLPRPGGGWGGR